MQDSYRESETGDVGDDEPKIRRRQPSIDGMHSPDRWLPPSWQDWFLSKCSNLYRELSVRLALPEYSYKIEMHVLQLQLLCA